MFFSCGQWLGLDFVLLLAGCVGLFIGYCVRVSQGVGGLAYALIRCISMFHYVCMSTHTYVHACFVLQMLHICMCMHMFAHACIDVCRFTCMHMFAWMHVYAHVCICLHMIAFMYVYAHVCTCLHGCMCMHMFAHVCTCLHGCIDAHVCTCLHMLALVV